MTAREGRSFGLRQAALSPGYSRWPRGVRQPRP